LSEITVKLHWTYTPVGFFEEAITLQRDGYQIEIADGNIVATTSAALFDSHPALHYTLTQELHGYFSGAQLLNYETFSIVEGAIDRCHPNGRVDKTIAVQGCGVLTLT